MECEDIIKYISDYFDSALDEESKKEFTLHMKMCERCKILCKTMRKTILLSQQLYVKEEIIPEEVIVNVYYEVRLRYKK